MNKQDIKDFCYTYTTDMDRVINTCRRPSHRCEACHLPCPLIYSCRCGMNICPICFDIGMIHFKSECECRFLSRYKIGVRLAQSILIIIRTEYKYDGSLIKWWNDKGSKIEWETIGYNHHIYSEKLK